MASDNDRFVPQPAGRFAARIAGQDYQLRRPTIGETRRWVEALTEVSEDRKAAVAAAADAGDVYDPVDYEAALIDWWRDVFATLDTGKAAGVLPDDVGDLPPWLLDVQLVAEVRVHWSSVPWGPGGSPTQQRAAAEAKAVAQTERMLDKLAAVAPLTQQQ